MPDYLPLFPRKFRKEKKKNPIPQTTIKIQNTYTKTQKSRDQLKTPEQKP